MTSFLEVLIWKGGMEMKRLFCLILVIVMLIPASLVSAAGTDGNETQSKVQETKDKAGTTTQAKSKSKPINLVLQVTFC